MAVRWYLYVHSDCANGCVPLVITFSGSLRDYGDLITLFYYSELQSIIYKYRPINIVAPNANSHTHAHTFCFPLFLYHTFIYPYTYACKHSHKYTTVSSDELF